LKDDRLLLVHIHREILFLRKICAGRTRDDLLSDEFFAHAVIRAIEVIGEATKNLSDTIKKRHPEIAWRGYAGSGNPPVF